jgi:hypothetical protein
MADTTEGKVGLLTLTGIQTALTPPGPTRKYWTDLYVQRPFGENSFEYKNVSTGGYPNIDDDNPVICLWHASDYLDGDTYHDPDSPMEKMIDWTNLTLYEGLNESNAPVYTTGWSIYEPEAPPEGNTDVIDWIPEDQPSIRFKYYISAWVGAIPTSVPLNTEQLVYAILDAQYEDGTPTYGVNATKSDYVASGPFIVEAIATLPCQNPALCPPATAINAAQFDNLLWGLHVTSPGLTGRPPQTMLLSVDYATDTTPVWDFVNEEYNMVKQDRILVFEPYYPANSGVYTCQLWYMQQDVPAGQRSEYKFAEFTVSVIMTDYTPQTSNWMYAMDTINVIRVTFSNKTTRNSDPNNSGFIGNMTLAPEPQTP